MKNQCDVCGKKFSGKGISLSAKEFKKIAASGFAPVAEAADGNGAGEKEKPSQESTLAKWKQRVFQGKGPWLLCSACAGKAAKYRKSLLFEGVEVLLYALVLYVIISNFVVQARVVPSESMVPTINVGDRFLANKFIFWFRPPQRGEIVVFKPPAKANAKFDYVKRVIGLPGETVELVPSKIETVNGREVKIPGKVLINGKELKEPWIEPEYQLDEIAPKEIAQYRGPYKVPADSFYMMGDNRNRSDDSRYWGTVSRGELRGLAVWRFWPLNNMSSMLPPKK